MTTKLNMTDSAAVLTALNTDNRVDASKVATKIKWIGSTGRKMDGVIHATAVACIYLSMPHEDGGHLAADRAIQLVNAMPNGSRVKALVAWFSAYSNIRLRYDKKAKVYTGGVLKPSNKGYADAEPTKAMASPFWIVEEKPTNPSEFKDSKQLWSAVSALIAKAERSVANLSDADKAKLASLKTAATSVASVDPLTMEA